MESQSGRIRVPKTSELVANKIRAQIIRGELTEGDTLPPESAMMATLGISRPTLREAFRILEAESLIHVVRGSRSGARVQNPSTELVSRYAGYVLEAQGTTIADLYSARLAIEPTVVRWLANAKGAAPGMAKLKQLLTELGAKLTSGHYDAFVDRLSHFHQMLVEASGNQTLSFVNRLLLNLWRNHQSDWLRRHPSSLGERHDMLCSRFNSYGELIAMIEAGDADGAEEHWRRHLRSSNEFWTAGPEGERIVDSLTVQLGRSLDCGGAIGRARSASTNAAPAFTSIGTARRGRCNSGRSGSTVRRPSAQRRMFSDAYRPISRLCRRPARGGGYWRRE